MTMPNRRRTRPMVFGSAETPGTAKPAENHWDQDGGGTGLDAGIVAGVALLTWRPKLNGGSMSG